MAEHTTTLVVGGGAPAEGLQRVWGGRHTGALAVRVLGQSRGLDVHVVPTASTRSHTRSGPERIPLSRDRVAVGAALAVVLPAGLTPLLLMAGDRVGLAGHSLAYLLTVVVVALVGGLWPALVCAVAASTLLNYFFIPPTHTFQVADLHNAVTLVGFLVVAGLVGAIVHRAATMTSAAARASAQARTLAAVAEGTIRGEEALPALLEQLRSSFGMVSVSLLAGADDNRDQGDEPWSVLRSVGPDAPTDPRESDVQVPAGPGLALALSGRALVAEERATLRAFAAQVRVVHERDQLSREAAVAERLEATGRLRDALLAAVGHDLRTPLAAATAAVTSLRSADVAWSPSERDELLATAEESLHRLTALVADLLDLSRLRSGTLTVRTETVWLDDVLGPALDELGVVPGGVQIDIPEALPPVVADAALLSRALVNVLANALRHSPAGERVIITASPLPGRVEIRVVDRGPGIPAAEHARVFQPFQRLGDSDNRTGLGLGLALSRGLVEAMSGALTLEDTPGGGLTMVIALPEGAMA
jgi:two-component system sensor histidine kinase KdpD